MTQKGTATELGNQPIGKLLTQYAIPAIIAMTASSLYNMVDSIFIGHGVGPSGYFGTGPDFSADESDYRFQYTHRCRWRCDQFYLLGTEG